MGIFGTTSRPADQKPSRDPRDTLLNILTGILVVVVVYLLFSFLQANSASRDNHRSRDVATDVIQTCAERVRRWGREKVRFLSCAADVVEMRNYKTSDLSESLVIDRRGLRMRSAALRRASERNIIQQPGFYVDVSA
jgi:hypothetical protein